MVDESSGQRIKYRADQRIYAEGKAEKAIMEAKKQKKLSDFSKKK